MRLPKFLQFGRPAAVKAVPDKKTLSGSRVTEMEMSTIRSVLPRDSGRYTRASLADLKYYHSPDELLKTLAKWDPDVSAGVWNFLRTCDSGHTVIAHDPKGLPNKENQEVIDAVLLRMSLTDNYAGFTMKYSLEQVATIMVKSLLIRGAIAAEAVLSPARTLSEIVHIDPPRVLFNEKMKPFMYGTARRQIDLDIPTFVWEVLDPDPETPYEQPPFLAAINAVLFRIAVMEDLQRVVKRTAFPRLSVKVIEEVLTKNAPAAIKYDDSKMAEFVRGKMVEIGQQLSNLAPDEAAVFLDSIEVGYLANESNPTVDFKPLFEVMDQQIISALKTLPTILGRQFSNSQTLSATESLLYTKSARGLQGPVEKAISRILTLALLLEGKQGYVKFKFKPIELRPQSELSQYKALDQARILELLSLGMITDEQAAEQLTGSPYLPSNYKELQGTMFYGKSGGKTGADDVNAASQPIDSPRDTEKTGKGRAPRGGSK